MMQPTKANLRQAMGEQGERFLQVFCSGTSLHPNPRMYKYFWRVFTLDSPWEEAEFFEKTPVLSTVQFVELMEEYRVEGVPCLVYNQSIPRDGSIFDKNSEKWKGVAFAPSWDDDVGRAWNGHK